MKSRTSTIFSLVGLVASLVTAQGQVILHPNQLGGTISFNNANPAILNLLNAPGSEGMSNVYVTAYSLPPAGDFTANSDTLAATTRTSSSYDLTVESGNPGIAYSVGPLVTLQG